MKKTLYIMLFGIVLVGTTSQVIGDSYDDDHKEYRLFNWLWSKEDVAPVSSKLYQDECGSCHFAYQPGLLPSASWKKMMTELDSHFGENAELDADTQATLQTYLLKNSAESADYSRFKNIATHTKTNAPQRITDTPYFQRKHDEIPSRLVKGNPKVGSFSQCDTCHTGAQKGSYDEHGVKIPGFGRWDD